MDSHGRSFLQQIFDLKHSIDQINVGIEATIRKTRAVELAIVQSSEKEHAARAYAEKWKQILIRREIQKSDLLAVTDAANENVAKLEEKLRLQENQKSEICFEIEKNRGAFIASCKCFQQELEMGPGAVDDYALTLQKSSRVSAVESPKRDNRSERFADDALSRNKMERFQQLQHVNAELQTEIDAENAQNEHLLRRIDGLNDAVDSLPRCQEISRLEEDFDLFSEEKRNLEDGIVTLQQQMPLLLSQEQKLGNLLKDQQRALQSLEQKIEEVKLLQEAYENDFQNQMKAETLVNQPAITNPQNLRPHEDSVSPPVSAGRQQALHGTWDSYQGQPGKRHRIM
ncbi:unnamed protein product [Calypogeia fissa]